MKRKARVTSRSKLNDTVPNPGPGLFLDPRARRSTVRAYRAICKFVSASEAKEIGLHWRNIRQHFRPRLTEVCRWYWANRDYDERFTFSDMKAGVRRLRRQATHLQKTISSLPQSTKKALDLKYRSGQADRLADDVPLGDIATSLQEIEKLCSALISRKKTRGKATHVERTCLSLWDIFEECVDRSFIRTWDDAKTHEKKIAERGRREFVNPDARLIQVALCAIDSRVEFTSIVQGLKAVASQKPRSE